MFEKSANARHKNEARVTIRVTGEEPFDAFVFLKIGERLIDLLNDDRKFIPVKRADGSTIITSKNNIVSIIEKLEGEAQTFAGAAMSPSPAPPTDETEEPSQPAPQAQASEQLRAEQDETSAEEPSPEAEPNCEEPPDADPGDQKRKHKRAFDPYEILRVGRDATAEEIRRAYKKRIKAVHPDSIAALDLDEDLARAANLSAQRVNRAYRMLMRERQESKPAEDAA